MQRVEKPEQKPRVRTAMKAKAWLGLKDGKKVEGKIVSETWQIDPKLNVALAATAETAGKTATY